MAIFTVDPLYSEDPVIFAIEQFNLTHGRNPTKQEILEELGNPVEFSDKLETVIDTSNRLKTAYEKSETIFDLTVELTSEGRSRSQHLHSLYEQVKSQMSRTLNFVTSYPSRFSFIPDDVIRKYGYDTNTAILWCLGYLDRVSMETKHARLGSFDRIFIHGYKITTKGLKFLSESNKT
jgi:Zn-dependent M32 family carboxypeptidase